MGLVAHAGEKHITGFWWVNLKERNLLGNQCAEMRIILKWVFKNKIGEHEPNSSGSRKLKWRKQFIDVKTIAKLRCLSQEILVSQY